LLVAVRRDDQTGDVDFGCLEVSWEVLKDGIALFSRRDAVVAHEWECNDQDLAAVGRVSNGLGVSDHTSLEDQLAGDAAIGTEAGSLAETNGGIAILDFESHEASRLLISHLLLQLLVFRAGLIEV
jgi:hypothetical protein